MKSIKTILFSVAMSGLTATFTSLAQNATLLTTITNPTPAVGDWFGHAVAALGNDRVLVGAVRDSSTGIDSSGAAYLFSASGTLLTTFTNPAPTYQANFGASLAAVGNDRVLIGEPSNDTGIGDAGAAFLFSTDGALLTVITNPTPGGNEYFGFSVAAAGNDAVLIGAPYDKDLDDFDPVNAGAAYLFSTNGTLLTTFTKPDRESYELFGWSVAAAGSGQVIVGAPYDNTGAFDAGAAYLFSAGGTLLTTFTNPTPAVEDQFGLSVVGVGNNRVLIGAPYDNTGASDAGSAYLFSTNGTLLTTFTNPVPQATAWFGWSVAAVGSDRVVIGALGGSSGGSGEGIAYLLSTNGQLLMTITNPVPEPAMWFGAAVAALGNNQVIVGARMKSIGLQAEIGEAYLFNVAPPVPPSIAIRFTTTNTVAVSWPSPSTGWQLQQNTNSISSVNWSNAPGTILDDGTTKTLIVNPPTGSRFYRLFKP